jgi:hypothetical protein
MNFLILILLIQTPTSTQKNFLFNPEHKETIQKQPQPLSKPILAPSAHETAPTLSPYSEPSPFELGREMGGQSEALGELRSQVSTLESDRQNVDRPDIESLQRTRWRWEITWSITSSILGTFIVTLLGAVWKFRKAIWKDMLRPRIAREVDLELSSKKSVSPLPETGLPPATH